MREDQSGAPGAGPFPAHVVPTRVAAGAVLLVLGLALVGILPDQCAALLLVTSVTVALSAYAAVPPRGFTWSVRRRRQARVLVAATLVVALLPAMVAMVASDAVVTTTVTRPGERVRLPPGWSHARIRLRNPSPGHEIGIVLGGAWPAVAAHLVRDPHDEHAHAHVDHGKSWRLFDVRVEGPEPELVVLAIDADPGGPVEVTVYPPAVPPTWSVLVADLLLVVVACVLSARAPLHEMAVPAVVAGLTCGLALRQAALAQEVELGGVLVTLLGSVLAGGLVGLVLGSTAGVLLRRAGSPRLEIRRR